MSSRFFLAVRVSRRELRDVFETWAQRLTDKKFENVKLLSNTDVNSMRESLSAKISLLQLEDCITPPDVDLGLPWWSDWGLPQWYIEHRGKVYETGHPNDQFYDQEMFQLMTLFDYEPRRKANIPGGYLAAGLAEEELNAPELPSQFRGEFNLQPVSRSVHNAGFLSARDSIRTFSRVHDFFTSNCLTENFALSEQVLNIAHVNYSNYDLLYYQ